MDDGFFHWEWKAVAGASALIGALLFLNFPAKTESSEGRLAVAAGVEHAPREARALAAGFIRYGVTSRDELMARGAGVFN